MYPDDFQKDGFYCKKGTMTIVGKMYYNRLRMTMRRPVIIFSHDMASNMYIADKYCDKFRDLGYLCVSYNFCGGGSSRDPLETQSDGASWNMTFDSEVADLITVVNYVKNLPDVDQNRIILWGEGFGGLVSAHVAAMYPDFIHRLIMVNPDFNAVNAAKEGRLAGAKYDYQNVPDKIDAGFIILGKKLHEELINMDPYEGIERFWRPVLIISGDSDKYTSRKYVKKAQEKYMPLRCRIVGVCGMRHNVREERIDDICEVVTRFLMGDKKLTYKIAKLHMVGNK